MKKPQEQVNDIRQGWHYQDLVIVSGARHAVLVALTVYHC